MKQTPILYSGEMVKAYPAGRKTETRRTRGLEEINKEPDKWKYEGYLEGTRLYIFKYSDGVTTISVKCPFGQAGDVLVGRETFYYQKSIHLYDRYERADIVHYKADSRGFDVKWKPSIFMPLEFSRIHQPLLADPVPQRVWDMTEAEAIAEGMETLKKLFYESTETLPISAVQIFAWYWDSLNAKRGYPWSGNFWVWKLVFPRHEG